MTQLIVRQIFTLHIVLIIIAPIVLLEALSLNSLQQLVVVDLLLVFVRLCFLRYAQQHHTDSEDLTISALVGSGQLLLRHGQKSGESHRSELAGEEGREGIEIVEHVAEERVGVAELLHASESTRPIDDDRRADHKEGTNLRGEKVLTEIKNTKRVKANIQSLIQSLIYRFIQDSIIQDTYNAFMNFVQCVFHHLGVFLRRIRDHFLDLSLLFLHELHHHLHGRLQHHVRLLYASHPSISPTHIVLNNDHQNAHGIALLHVADLRIEHHAAHKIVHQLQVALSVELVVQHARARNAHIAVNHREESTDIVDRLGLNDRQQTREQLPDHVLRRLRVAVEVGEGANDHQTGVVEIALVLRENLHDRGQHCSDHRIVVLGILAAVDHNAANAVDGAHRGEHCVVVVFVLLVVLESRQQDVQDLGTHREQAVFEHVDEHIETLHNLFDGYFLEDEDVSLHNVLEILTDVLKTGRVFREERLQTESCTDADGEVWVIQKVNHVAQHIH